MMELFAQSAPLASDPEKIKKIAAIENCLKNCYRVEDKAIAAIVLKMSPFIDRSENWHFVEEFIEKSHLLKIPFSEKPINSPLLPEDAVLQAPKWHEVLFESPLCAYSLGEIPASRARTFPSASVEIYFVDFSRKHLRDKKQRRFNRKGSVAHRCL